MSDGVCFVVRRVAGMVVDRVPIGRTIESVVLGG